MGLKVGLVVGDKRTPHCGVKDYAYRLAEALRERGTVAEVYAPDDWSCSSFLSFRRELRALQLDVVHVQYPSVGVRWSLLPHVIGLAGIAAASCTTLHEYQSKGLPQRLCAHLFRFSSKAILFTTDGERENYAQVLQAIGPQFVTVNIGSNLPTVRASEVKDQTVLYFGQIRPQKGIESFLRLAHMSNCEKRPFRFQVLGACLPRHAEYFRSLQGSAPQGVEWLIGLPAEEVAARMSRSLAAYLPFPDGASCRRGSLLASLVNGLPVISKVSHATPEDLASVLLPADSAEQALSQLDALMNDRQRAETLATACRKLGRQFSWSSIAEVHQALYEKLLASEAGEGGAVYSGARAWKRGSV